MPQTQRLAPMVLGNDKLLKALIILLALKDEHLLDELRTIFVVAHRHHSPIGDAGDEVWAHVRGELELITSLLEETDEDEVEATSVPN